MGQVAVRNAPQIVMKAGEGDGNSRQDPRRNTAIGMDGRNTRRDPEINMVGG
jgi:hypothetical protein